VTGDRRLRLPRALAALALAVAAAGASAAGAAPIGSTPPLSAAAPGVPTAGSAAAARLVAAVSGARAALGAGARGQAARRLAAAPAGAGPLLSPIDRDLRTGHPGAAAQALAALGSELQGGRRPVPAEPAVRRALALAYADPALHVREPGGTAAGPGAAGVLGWIRRLLGALFHLLPRPAWILLGVLVVLAGSWLAWWRLGVAAGARPGPQAEPASGPAAPDPEAAWRLAQAAAAAGRNRDAVRLAFQALLLTVARRHALVVDPAWTNAELLAAAEAAGAFGPRLLPLVSTFDRVVYGGEDPGAAGWSAFASGCRAALATLG